MSLPRPRAWRRQWLAVALLALVLVALAATATRSAAATSSAFCYLVGDRDHVLTRMVLDNFDPRTNETTLGATHTLKTDAIALHPHTGALYGVNIAMDRSEGYLGLFNTDTGRHQPFDAPLGRGLGPLGPVNIYDISGLAFDPATGWLYAVKILVGPGMPDVLFRLDPHTGHVVHGAFGGDDYVVLLPLRRYPHLSDVDDIAIDPATGQMYGIVNNSSDGDRLVRIDKETGALTDVGPFGPEEVEGLDFDARGRLWATAGGDRLLPNMLYQVDPATGQAFAPRPLDNSANYEALACHAPTPHIRPSTGTRN